MTEPNKMGRPRLYSDAERADRRRAAKAASDRRCRERKTANAAKYRAVRIAKGLTAQGKPRAEPKPRANPKTKALRPFITDLVNRSAYVAPTACQSVDEWLAAGGVPEVLPGFRYVAAAVMPVGARYGVAG